MGGRSANGEGSLYRRRADGRWIGAVVIGYDEDGNACRKTVSGKTRSEAFTRLRDLQGKLAHGLPPPDDRLTLGELFDDWLGNVVPLRVAKATAANYESLVRMHIDPVFGRQRLSQLQPGDVQHFVNTKLATGLSARTVRLLRGLLVQVLEYAVRQGKVVRNVASLTDGPRQQGESSGRSLTIEQAKQLIEAIKGERLEALYVLMLSTGIRPGEAFALPWKNVDLDRSLVTVNQSLVRQPGGTVIGSGKTGRKGWRTIQIPEPVVSALRQHRIRQEAERLHAGELWEDHDLVFCTAIGTPLDPDSHRKAFARLTERAGIGRWHPHELRHSATSIMLAQGVPIDVVSKVLGHTSIRITADVYGHMLEKQRELAAEAMKTALWD